MYQEYNKIVYYHSRTKMKQQTHRGMSISRNLSRAINSELPPRIISVPRPAMLVAMVTAPERPLWATISASLSTFSGFALRTWQKMIKSSQISMKFSKTSTLWSLDDEKKDSKKYSSKILQQSTIVSTYLNQFWGFEQQCNTIHALTEGFKAKNRGIR